MRMSVLSINDQSLGLLVAYKLMGFIITDYLKESKHLGVNCKFYL